MHVLMVLLCLLAVIIFVCRELRQANPDHVYKRIYRQIEKERRQAVKQQQKDHEQRLLAIPIPKVTMKEAAYSFITITAFAVLVMFLQYIWS